MVTERELDELAKQQPMKGFDPVTGEISTALAPWEPKPGETAALSSTLPPKETLRALNDTVPLSDFLGKTIRVRHVMAHPATVGRDEGEVEAVRIVLQDVKGVNYSCVSEGVMQSLRQIGSVYGNPPWEDGLALEVIQVNTRGGFRVYKLVPA
jgi:hypothetical protein